MEDHGRYKYRIIVPVAYPIPGDVRFQLSPSLSHFTFFCGLFNAAIFFNTEENKALWLSS